MIRRLSRSLSFRLLAIFLLLGLLFVFGTLKAIQRFYNSDEIRGLVSGHLSLHVQYVRDDIGTPPRIDRALAITRRVPVDIRILGPSIDWASDPAFPRVEALEFGPSPRFGDAVGAWADELGGIDFATTPSHAFLRMQQGGYQILVSTPRISDVDDSPDLVNQVIVMGLFLVLLAYMAARWLFKPIGAIREGAAKIGRGNFQHRIGTVRSDELGDLASDIDKLAGDVERMLDAKRALLLGISHELRTPLSRMRLQLEFIDDEEQRDALRPEIVEMEKIVAALLEAERLNVRHAQLSRTRVAVGELIDELIDDFFSRDRERIRVIRPEAPVTADLDEGRITLLLKNLLSNALRYSQPEDGPVELGFEQRGSELVFFVRDRGPGIPPGQASHIGEPFYRGDPSRARQSGGTGLGLYLATLVARAHDGRLELVESDEPGAHFEVRIPYD